MRMSPLTFVAIIAGILILVAIYTVIIAFVGYKCGFRIVRCLTPMKAPTGNVKGKMTMTSVTYTSLRNSKHPRFFFSDQIEGCWEYACWSGDFVGTFLNNDDGYYHVFHTPEATGERWHGVSRLPRSWNLLMIFWFDKQNLNVWIIERWDYLYRQNLICGLWLKPKVWIQIILTH